MSSNDPKMDVNPKPAKAAVHPGPPAYVYAGGHRISSQAVLTTPIVMERDKKRKRGGKKRYSRGTKFLQRMMYGFSRAGYRTTNSTADGLRTFVKRSNKSSGKRRDGMIRDVLRNASRGVADGFAQLGKAPGEIARRVGTRRVWRVFRGATGN